MIGFYFFVILAFIEVAVAMILFAFRVKWYIEEKRWEKAEKARREKALREGGLYKLCCGPLKVECIEYTKD